MDYVQLLNNINSGLGMSVILIRTFILFFYAIFLLRMNSRLHLNTSFDFVIIISIGAILSRGIYAGDFTLLQTVSSTLLITLLHTFCSRLTFYSTFIGKILKGSPIILYQNGKFNKVTMKNSQITKEDIMASLRSNMNTSSLSSIDQINMERTGDISFIKKVSNY